MEIRYTKFIKSRTLLFTSCPLSTVSIVVLYIEIVRVLYSVQYNTKLYVRVKYLYCTVYINCCKLLIIDTLSELKVLKAWRLPRKPLFCKCQHCELNWDFDESDSNLAINSTNRIHSFHQRCRFITVLHLIQEKQELADKESGATETHASSNGRLEYSAPRRVRTRARVTRARVTSSPLAFPHDCPLVRADSLHAGPKPGISAGLCSLWPRQSHPHERTASARIAGVSPIRAVIWDVANTSFAYRARRLPLPAAALRRSRLALALRSLIAYH